MKRNRKGSFLQQLQDFERSRAWANLSPLLQLSPALHLVVLCEQLFPPRQRVGGRGGQSQELLQAQTWGRCSGRCWSPPGSSFSVMCYGC